MKEDASTKRNSGQGRCTLIRYVKEAMDMDKERPIPDPDLTEEEKDLVANLSQQDLKAIDEALLSNAKYSWRKVAMVVGITMMNLPNRGKGIPDVFYSQRIRKLVENGCLESQGDLQYMRFSEVRIPGGKDVYET